MQTSPRSDPRGCFFAPSQARGGKACPMTIPPGRYRGGNHSHIVITMRRRGAKSPARREIHSYESLIEIRHSLQLELRHASLLPLPIYLHYALRKAPRLTQFHLAKLCLLLIRDSYKRAKGGGKRRDPGDVFRAFSPKPGAKPSFLRCRMPMRGRPELGKRFLPCSYPSLRLSGRTGSLALACSPPFLTFR
jgi:hypothetical protein